MKDSTTGFRQAAVREAAWLLGLLIVGLGLLPLAIWFTGQVVFGEYGGAGFGDFYGGLIARLVDGDRTTWFLVLSPYLAVQVLRLTALALRRTGTLSR